MLVGETMASKSTVIKVLAQSLSTLRFKPHSNESAVTTDSLSYYTEIRLTFSNVKNLQKRHAIMYEIGCFTHHLSTGVDTCETLWAIR